MQISAEEVTAAAAKLRDVAKQHGRNDPEAAHDESIRILKEFLTKNGMSDLVAAYEEANSKYWR